MATLRFKDVAHQAVTSTLVFRVTQMESPKDWDLSRIGSHRLYETPYQHYEEDMEHSQEKNNSPIIYQKQIWLK